PHTGPGGTPAVRARRSVGRARGLLGGSCPERALLSGHPFMVAGPAGRRAATCLRRAAPEDFSTRRASGGLPNRGSGGARHPCGGEPVRNRVAGAHGLARDREARGPAHPMIARSRSSSTTFRAASSGEILPVLTTSSAFSGGS